MSYSLGLVLHHHVCHSKYNFLGLIAFTRHDDL